VKEQRGYKMEDILNIIYHPFLDRGEVLKRENLRNYLSTSNITYKVLWIQNKKYRIQMLLN